MLAETLKSVSEKTSRADALERRRLATERAAKTAGGKIVACLAERRAPVHVDEVASATGLPVRIVKARLHDLRMRGRVVCTSRGFYAIGGAAAPRPIPQKYRVLAALARGPVRRDALIDAAGGDRGSAARAIRFYRQAGAIDENDGVVSLTDAGRARVEALVLDLRAGIWIYSYEPTRLETRE